METEDVLDWIYSQRISQTMMKFKFRSKKWIKTNSHINSNNNEEMPVFVESSETLEYARLPKMPLPSIVKWKRLNDSEIFK